MSCRVTEEDEVDAQERPAEDEPTVSLQADGTMVGKAGEGVFCSGLKCGLIERCCCSVAREQDG